MNYWKKSSLVVAFLTALAPLTLLPCCIHGHRSGSDVLVITTSTLPGTPDDPWPVGVVYEATLSAARKHGPYDFTWTLDTYIDPISGEPTLPLPDGLVLSSGGIIAGTPTTTGTFIFVVKVIDSAPEPDQMATKSLSITIGDPPAFEVDPQPLPVASVGIAYSATLATTGAGVPPYTWFLDPSSPPLPDGLNLASTGHIVGTPTQAGSFSFVVVVADSSQPNWRYASVLKTIDVTIIGTASLPKGRVSQPYSCQLSASGGIEPYAWSISSGNLPNGLSLNSATGEITGTPLESGLLDITVMITDAILNEYVRNLSLQIDPAQELRITTDPTLLAGQVGLAYALTITAVGGTEPYTFSLDAGSLPPGLSFSTGGILSGLPETPGIYTFVIKVVDSTDPVAGEAVVSFSLTIDQAGLITIRQGTLPTTVEDDLYQTILTAIGGTPPYTWSISSGNFPSGLSLGSNGVISGVASSSGIYTFVVEATDATLAKGTRSLTLEVVTELVVETASPLPYAVRDDAYSCSLSATGGKPPYLWSLDTGSPDLPSDLVLTTGGHITGIPLTSGQSSFVVKVTDSSSPARTATKALVIDVRNPLTITTTSLPNATENSSYSYQLQAAGGSGSYQWSAIGLPSGLSCVESTGYITGTPAAGTNLGSPYTISVTVEDVYIPSISENKTLSLTVYPPP